MKIIQITSVHPVNDNRIFYKECKTLKQAGHEVILLVAGTSDTIREGIQVIGWPKENARIKRFWKTSLFDLLRLCKKVDGDVYHFHDPEIIFAGVILKLKGKKVVYDIHENYSAAIFSKNYIKSKLVKLILSFWLRIFEKFVVLFFDGIVTARPDISECFSHKNLITLRNFPILPNLNKICDLDFVKKKPAVIYVGGMTEIRGISQLIDAIAKTNAELWLLGPIKETPLNEKIKKGCKNVKYFGCVEASEIFPYIKKADIGIVTFLNYPNHVRTLATKPFEYMACGKPMIMSDFPYWKEVFGKSSLYADPENSDEIAEKIQFLLNDSALFNKMSELNLNLSINEFNWEQESKSLINLYADFE